MPILDSENSTKEKNPLYFKFTNLEPGIVVHLFYYIVIKNIYISTLSCV